jgi:transcription elongation factor Elf1
MIAKDSEDSIEPDTQSLFYYAECPHCGMEFAVWNMLKPTGEEVEGLGEGVETANEDDIIKIHCPRCGQSFPLVVCKAPEVYLIDSPFRERLTE